MALALGYRSVLADNARLLRPMRLRNGPTEPPAQAAAPADTGTGCHRPAHGALPPPGTPGPPPRAGSGPSAGGWLPASPGVPSPGDFRAAFPLRRGPSVRGPGGTRDRRGRVRRAPPGSTAPRTRPPGTRTRSRPCCRSPACPARPGAAEALRVWASCYAKCPGPGRSGDVPGPRPGRSGDVRSPRPREAGACGARTGRGGWCPPRGLPGPGPPRSGAEPRDESARWGGRGWPWGPGRGGPGAGSRPGTRGGGAGRPQARSEAAPAAAPWTRAPRTTSSTATCARARPAPRTPR